MENIIYKYLKLINYKYEKEELQNFLISHPNYPSLFAVNEALNNSEIEHITANIPFNHFNKLPNIFITEFAQNLYIVHQTINDISVIGENFSKKVSLQELEKEWIGNVLVIEKSEKLKIKKIKKINFLFIGIIVLLGVLQLILNFKYSNLIYMITTTIGVFLTIEILKTFFNNENSILCENNNKTSCNEIINSNEKVLFLSIIDLPVLFFISSVCVFLFNPKLTISIGIYSIISIPFIFYSIYLQKYKYKKWCILCLYISFLLFINVITCFYFSNFQENIYKTLGFIPFLIIIFFSWKSYKDIKIKFNFQNKKHQNLLRLIRNEEVFYNINQKILEEEVYNKMMKLKIGIHQVSNKTLTLILNPSCVHCNKSYKKALDLINKNKNFNLQLLYYVDIIKNDSLYSIVPKVIYKLQNENLNIIEALNDYYLNNFTLEEWNKKWNKYENYYIESEQLNENFNWFVKNDFNYSPVHIFDNLILNKNYDLEDILYFLD